MLRTAFSVWTQFTVRTGKKVDTRDECYWSHAWQRFKLFKGVKLNGIVSCKFLSEKSHRTSLLHLHQPPTRMVSAPSATPMTRQQLGIRSSESELPVESQKLQHV
jgi:hypothetical protein